MSPERIFNPEERYQSQQFQQIKAIIDETISAAREKQRREDRELFSGLIGDLSEARASGDFPFHWVIQLMIFLDVHANLSANDWFSMDRKTQQQFLKDILRTA